jgi:hypothetical protein
MCPETFNLWVIVDRIMHRHRQQFSSSAWAGIVGDCLVGPDVLPHRLTGSRCRVFLLHDPLKLLGHVPLAVRTWMLCTYDGAPAYFNRAVRNFLNNIYRDRRMGKGGPTHCMASALDGFESSRFLPVERLKPYTMYVCSFCWQSEALLLIADACPDHQQLLRHVWTEAAAHEETRRSMHWISWRTFYNCTLSAKLHVSGHMVI